MAEARSSQEAGLLRALGDAETVRSRAATAAEEFISALSISELVEGLADEGESEALAEELTEYLLDVVGAEFAKAARLHAKSLGQRPMPVADLNDLLHESLAENELDLARQLGIELDRARGRIAAVEEAGAVDAVEWVLRGPFAESMLEPFKKAARLSAISSISGAFDAARAATREAREAIAGREGRALFWTWLTVGDERVCDNGVFANSCAPRHGKVKTMDDWERHGFPQSPNLTCSLHAPPGTSYCRCDLVEASRFDVPLKPVDASAALAAAREPFKRQKMAKVAYQRRVVGRVPRSEEFLKALSDLLARDLAKMPPAEQTRALAELEKLGPEFMAALRKLLGLANEELPRLIEALDKLNSIPGVHFGKKGGYDHTAGARVKQTGSEPSARLLQKLENKQPYQISDYLGGRVYYDSPENVQQVIDAIRAAGYRVDSVDNFLDDPISRYGYRAVHIQIVNDAGLSVELQIVPREIGMVKDYWHEEVFSVWRDRKNLTPEEEEEKERALARMRAGYDEAWAAFLRRLGIA